jgi:hypothetical protein
MEVWTILGRYLDGKRALIDMSRSLIIQRSAGLLLLLGVLVLLDPLKADIIHRLLLPLAAMFGCALILRSLMAIALATAILALLAINLSGDIYQTRIYPVLAFIALLLVTVEVVRRFGGRIRDSHAQRWKPRMPEEKQEEKQEDNHEP